MALERIGNQPRPVDVNLKNRVSTFRDTGVSFADLMREKVQPQELKISTHAANRIKSRGIEMNDEVKAKLNKAIGRVADKGGKDALLMMNDAAFIVNVPNRTVVTAMDRDNLKENVFTNIDSAAVVD